MNVVPLLIGLTTLVVSYWLGTRIQRRMSRLSRH